MGVFQGGGFWGLWGLASQVTLWDVDRLSFISGLLEIFFSWELLKCPLSESSVV